VTNGTDRSDNGRFGPRSPPVRSRTYRQAGMATQGQPTKRGSKGTWHREVLPLAMQISKPFPSLPNSWSRSSIPPSFAKPPVKPGLHQLGQDHIAHQYWRKDGCDLGQPDKHMPSARYRPATVSYAVADQPIASSPKRTFQLAARPVETVSGGTLALVVSVLHSA
jgi:hypothetical protein